LKYSPLNNNSQEKIDGLSIFLFIVLVIIGFLSISSATSDVNQEFYSLSPTAIKQLIWIGGSIVIIFTILYSNVVVIDYFTYGFYAVAILLNIAVLFLGREVSGAKSWFGFGGIGIQPSEFAKVATAMALARRQKYRHLFIDLPTSHGDNFDPKRYGKCIGFLILLSSLVSRRITWIYFDLCGLVDVFGNL
jgi:rod shape determining protein RodA